MNLGPAVDGSQQNEEFLVWCKWGTLCVSSSKALLCLNEGILYGVTKIWEDM